jgi:serine/threonine-protein kinase RsbW
VKEILSLVAASRLDNLNTLVEGASQAAREAGFSEDDAMRVELVCEEAVMNIINHAYEGREPGDIEIACFSGEGGEFVMEICDRGPEFNPLHVPPPDLEADLTDRKVGGLGLHLIRNLTGRWSYERNGDRNVLSMVLVRNMS